MTDFRRPLTIAVDGPSGSGKSTTSRLVARDLGIAYLDTGAMYRALTWWCVDQGVDLSDQERVAAEASTFPLEMVTDPADPGVRIGDRDLDGEIRTSAISTVVSQVATNLDVRAILQQRQRDIMAAEADRTGGCIAEGRDITTVVAPDADVRILLIADEDERLRRRTAELYGEADPERIAVTRDQVVRRDADDATVSQFRTASDGVVTIDSSTLGIDAVVAAVLSLVPRADDDGAGEPLTRAQTADDQADAADDQDAAIGRTLRAGLDDYALDEEDHELLADEWDTDDLPAVERRLPVLAVVGRPNVGKSTFVNRVLGRREAVVEDRPGVTRDRVFYPAEWAGTEFLLVDTGGWEPKTEGIHAHVAEQAEVAISLADAILFVVDVNTGVTAADEQMVKVLRRAKKPVVLAANKVDDERGELEAAALWSLGLGEPQPVSALHGRGSGDLLDVVVAALPEEGSVFGPADGPRRVALLGRPNVGKSSLLNRLAGSERVVVDDVAGTTRDPVDELVELGGKPWRFVDTAGIRKRISQAQGADFYASLRTRAALEKAEVAVVLLEASEPISVQDLKVIDMVLQSGRALVLAFNKWDLIDEERHAQLEIEIERDLSHVAWAPRVNVSASTGWHVGKLVVALETGLASWDRRIPTGRLNATIGQLVAAHPHPLRGGKQPRILFATQARTRPPRFVIFASGFLEHGYRRFIERRLRETFDFRGTPIAISVRVREKRGRGK